MSQNEIVLDEGRAERMGLPEAILCEQKSVTQLQLILERWRPQRTPLLLTRLTDAQASSLTSWLKDTAPAEQLLDHRTSRTAYYLPEGSSPTTSTSTSTSAATRVAVVSAGTSDVFVAQEAIRTLAFHGVSAVEVYDVGVAGLHRYMARRGAIAAADVVIVCAGMDAALVSVIGGDVKGVVIAVPTSVGYGVAAGGHAALHATLASCASGVVVVNIDNGYGAACAALRVLGLHGGRGALAKG
jgi:NCAIR mutase (PurE)-related protein